MRYYVDVDVDIDDVIDEMSDQEKRDLCVDLIDAGYGPIGIDPAVESISHPTRDMYMESIGKLIGAYHRLSAEYIATIEAITQKL